MTQKPFRRIFQVVSGVLVGLSLAFWVLRSGREDGPAAADSHFLDDPLPAPTFTLTSQDGNPVGPQDFPEKVVIVFFGYTSCPDICPLTLSNMSRAFEEMGEDGSRIQFLLVTVDPARDTPERLREYLGAFHPSFLGLTGEEEEIREVATAFGAFFARSGEGPDYTVDHSARAFVIDPSGHISLTFPVTATPEEIARDLTHLLENQP